MEIINGLKAKIGGAEVEKVSQFLGESTDAVSKSLDLALNAMLGGLKGVALNQGDASIILKVINDGGHSGDLTDDLPRLFNNPDKVQLLITIGKNINNHFFNSKAGVLIEKLAEVCSMSKTSASSLFSLAAPLILGVLGKSIKTEGLDLAGFTAKLKNENLSIDANTSALLLGSLGFAGNSNVAPKVVVAPQPVPEVKKVVERPVTPVVHTQEEETEPEIIIRKKPKSESAINWLAWVFLALLGLAAIFYTFKGKYLNNPNDGNAISSKDSTFYESEREMFENLDTDRNKTLPTSSSSNSGLNDLSAQEESGDDADAQTKDSFNSPAFSSKPAEQKVEPKTPAVASKASPKVGSSTPAPARTSNSGSKERAATPTVERATRDTRPMSVKLADSNSFSGINGISYKNNSAEIRNKGAVNDVVSYLKSNPGKTIQIAGTGSSDRMAEDRAYGLQGALYEAGISTSRIQILSNAVQGDGPVVVKIK